MGKAKRLTPEEIAALVGEQLEVHNATLRRRAEHHADTVLRKLSQGKFEIIHGGYYSGQLRVHFTTVREYDKDHFKALLRDAGWIVQAIEWDDNLFRFFSYWTRLLAVNAA